MPVSDADNAHHDARIGPDADVDLGGACLDRVTVSSAAILTSP
jgi:hypothetical protein